jgi:hypothetical protein
MYVDLISSQKMCNTRTALQPLQPPGNRLRVITTVYNAESIGISAVLL